MSAVSQPKELWAGAEGRIDGQVCRIEGSAELCTQGTDTYVWTEYSVAVDGGSRRILSLEQTGYGRCWRLFAQVDDAARLEGEYRAGDRVEYDGQVLNVTYVGQSRVTKVSGIPPTGYEVGQVDRFWNAENNGTMLVCSLRTNGKRTYYLGREMPRGQVERVFGLAEESLARGVNQSESWSWQGILGALVVMGILGMKVADAIEWRSSFADPPSSVVDAETIFPLGQSLQVEGRHWWVARECRIELRREERWEETAVYVLESKAGRGLLWRERVKSEFIWHWFIAAAPPHPLTPERAAARRSKERIGEFEVRSLLQYRIIEVSGGDVLPTLPGPPLGQGLRARNGDAEALCVWNRDLLTWYEGRRLLPEAVAVAR